MNKTATSGQRTNWILVIAGLLQAAAFFLAWVKWNSIAVAGSDMPSGKFFKISEESFMLSNPVPQFDFAFILLWLIPVLGILVAILAWMKKTNAWLAGFAGLLALTLVTVYYLFSNVLIDLGVKRELQAGYFVAAIAAFLIIVASVRNSAGKIIALLIGPLFAWASFTIITNKVENEGFGEEKADYTITADNLIKEFMTSDSAANAKYREKILAVSGAISNIETPNDSTVNIKFIDSTTGSYAIFPLLNEEAKTAKNLKQGENISVKGSCSGGVFSAILGTEFINFKRCSLITKK